MPIYMDVHKGAAGATPGQIESAHMLDLEVQERYGVKYLRYWFNEPGGRVFCLVDSPSPEAAIAVHRESHAMLPDEIIEVQPQDVASFLGTMGENHSGTRLSEVPGGTGAGLDTALRTIMFTDMEGSTALTQRLGDEKAFELIRRHDSVVRAALADCKGCEVKHTGDGMMASFVSTRKAVECSIAIERDLAAHAERYPEHAVRVSIGLSAGEPVADNDDLFGAAVQLAARACGEAEPGQILASSVVRDLCIGKTFEFRHVGEVPLKGFAEPMPLYEVMWHQ